MCSEAAFVNRHTIFYRLNMFEVDVGEAEGDSEQRGGFKSF